MTTLLNIKKKQLCLKLNYLSLALLLPTPGYAQSQEEKLYPLSIVSEQGYHSDQPLAVLSNIEQSGSDNDWPTYIEFYQ